MHIIEDDPQYQPQDLDLTDPWLRDQMEAAGKQLLDQACQRASEANVSYETVLQWGAIPEQVARTHLANIQSPLDLLRVDTLPPLVED